MHFKYIYVPYLLFEPFYTIFFEMALKSINILYI